MNVPFLKGSFNVRLVGMSVYYSLVYGIHARTQGKSLVYASTARSFSIWSRFSSIPS